MNHVGKISIRPLTELVSDCGSIKQNEAENEDFQEIQETPKKGIRKKRKAATTSKKRIKFEATASATIITTATTEVKKPRGRKDPLPGQLRIDSFYKSAAKTYTVPKTIVKSSIAKTCKSLKKPKRRRKALFLDDDSSTTTSDDKNFVIPQRKTKLRANYFIDLCSENEAEQQGLNNREHNNEKKVLSTSSPEPNERGTFSIAFEASLKTIDEVTTVEETITTDFQQAKENSKTLVSSPTTWQSDINPNTLLTPKKSEIKNCDVWLEKKSPKLHSTSNETPKEDICLDVNKNVPRKTRSSTRKSNKSSISNLDQLKEPKREQVINPTSSKSRKRILENNVNPPSSVSNMEPACSYSDKRKKASHKNSILSPSDSNTSGAQMRMTKEDINSNIKQEDTKLPTPPYSTTRSSTLCDDAQAKIDRDDILLENAFLDDIVTISDEENIGISKSTTKSKTKKRGKQTTKTPKTQTKKATKAPRPCPPYKIVEGTTFAVDAFRYGDIEGVTNYFLTHFHADHYIGLNRQFSHPLYLSSITARLLRVFIPIGEQYIKEISLNTPIEIDDVEVTAIDANHCPGAVMFIFKTRQGRCILHTGDFRACAEMESEPIFWNNDIHTIYLDTTYFPRKYAFCTQSESIDQALQIIEEFNEKNIGTRILYVCGSYLIGKEKFWSTIAHKLSLKVWTDGNRKKALAAVNDENNISLLVDDPCEAHMHVIPMVHLSYFSLVEYIDKYSKYFDILFALRPSGWEKNSKPQFRGKVNIVGIEYSEHSSHDELKRFVQYLKPQKVISTVPVSHDVMKTAKIPDNWYKYDTLTGMQHQFQPAITNYFKTRSRTASSNETTPVDQKVAPNSSNHINTMLISPLEICNSAVPVEEPQKSEKKIHIFDAEEDDDWLT